MTSPDPITDPQAYQQHLLALLGADDPAVVQEATALSMAQMSADAGPHLRRIPQPGEWSVLGCIAHVVDAEVAMSGRYRWIVAHDRPPLVGYDQDLWVERLHPRRRLSPNYWRCSNRCAQPTWPFGAGVATKTGPGWVSTASGVRKATTSAFG